MTKDILNQYYDLCKEIKELRNKINRLEYKIPKLEEQIANIEAGEMVKDKVYGGEGGWQSFTIEGVPVKEYHDKQMELNIKRRLLDDRITMLSTLELESLRMVNEIEAFINSIQDSHTRRIVRLRVVDCLSWNEVADEIGGGNTEDSVRMAFNRYVK